MLLPLCEGTLVVGQADQRPVPYNERHLLAPALDPPEGQHLRGTLTRFSMVSTVLLDVMLNTNTQNRLGGSNSYFICSSSVHKAACTKKKKKKKETQTGLRQH